MELYIEALHTPSNRVQKQMSSLFFQHVIDTAFVNDISFYNYTANVAQIMVL